MSLVMTQIISRESFTSAYLTELICVSDIDQLRFCSARKAKKKQRLGAVFFDSHFWSDE